MDGSTMLFDENEVDGNPDDVLARRMKNRERQRRYRARKRHESDLLKALVVHQPNYQPIPSGFDYTPKHLEIPVQVEIPITVPSSNILTRVHCQRDWKKDARSAHMHNKLEVRSNGHNNSEMIALSGIQASSLQSSAKSDLPSTDSNGPVFDNSGTQKLISSRRDWKSEARNKKSSE